MKRYMLALSLFSLLALAGSAQATTSLFLDDCDDQGCEGSTLLLEVDDLAGDDWLVTYTIDTTNYTGSLTSFNQIGFKAIADWSSVTLQSAPNGTANWSNIFEAPISANSQCTNVNTGSSFVCIFSQNSPLNITGGGTYTWVFLVDGGTLLPKEDWHLGAQYANGLGPARGHIISATGEAIPEPSAALLFGVGAILVSRRMAPRRR